jgi:hypothetical protein
LVGYLTERALKPVQAIATAHCTYPVWQMNVKFSNLVKKIYACNSNIYGFDNLVTGEISNIDKPQILISAD